VRGKNCATRLSIGTLFKDSGGFPSETERSAVIRRPQSRRFWKLMASPVQGTVNDREAVARLPPGALCRRRADNLGATISRVPCLNSEFASRATLAFKAVAHGDTNGVALACEPKLSATVIGLSRKHYEILSPPSLCLHPATSSHVPTDGERGVATKRGTNAA
jgi:hypothetical protein